MEGSLSVRPPDGVFDYVICTGVIHHTADPAACLTSIARALKPEGILELMVYNAHHRWGVGAIREALHTLVPSDEDACLEARLELAQELIAGFPLRNTAGERLSSLRGAPAEMIADALLPPVERAFTVSSLAELLRGADLEYVLPCVNQFDKIAGRLSWNLDLASEGAARRYADLPPIDRWQVSNLLMGECSPMLWFYVQRTDSPFRARTEQDVCDDFLFTRFRHYRTEVTNYIRVDGEYRRADRPVTHPNPATLGDADALAVLDAVEATSTIADVLDLLAIAPSFGTVNRIRTQLTTPLFPFLTAVPTSA